jgi:uncharacterized repeat protein (TIGR03803 family)
MMRHSDSSHSYPPFSRAAIIGLLLLASIATSVGFASTLTTLYSFSGPDGNNPHTGLVLGSDGNLYGTTGPNSDAGTNVGTMFQITPSGVLTTLVQFSISTGALHFGYDPSAPIQASDGNFYGAQGQASFDSLGQHSGSVFNVTTGGNFTTLVTNIDPSPSGIGGVSGLIQATDGNFYGTTEAGNCVDTGANASCGSIYKVTPNGVLTTLHTFSYGPIGYGVGTASLVEGGDHNFYGMTGAGAKGFGTIFQMTPSGALTTLYSFSGNCDGTGPTAATPTYLLLGADGNFYGTSGAVANTSENGTIFKLTPNGTLTTLYVFSGTDGSIPSALIQGSDGNLYGTTAKGGTSGAGTAFQLSTSGVLTTLYSFTGMSDGGAPRGQIVLSSDLTTIYGTTFAGGANSLGSVFQLSGITSGNSSGSSSAICSNVPTGIVAAAGNAQVTLTWTAGSVAGSYNIYQGTSAGGEATTATVSGITGSATTISGLRNDTAYYFKVGAVNPGGNVVLSSEVSATPSIPVPSPPSLQSVTASDSQVVLNWTPSVGATSYNVYQGTSAGAESSTPVKTGVTSTNLTIGGLSNGATYYFTVAAVNAVGTSPVSNESSAALPTTPSPTGLTAVASENQVVLTWTAVGGASSYNIYEGTTAGGESTTPVRTGATGTTGTVFSGLTNGTTYYFTIAAVNSSGVSSFSNEASGTPSAPATPPPAAPTGLTAVGGNNQISLTWNSSPDATSYNIYMGPSASGELATPVMGGVIGTTATIASLQNSTKYYFKVAALNTSGASAQSSESAAITEASAGSSGSGGGAIDPLMIACLATLVVIRYRRVCPRGFHRVRF